MPTNTDIDTADFLVLAYREIDFLINRSQFSGSSSLNEIRESGFDTPDYFNKYTDYNKKSLVLCDFDQFLMDRYRCSNPSQLKLCLIIRIDEFDNKSSLSIMEIIRQHENSYSDIIGLIVSSQVEMRPLKLSGFNLNPPGLNSRLYKNGLLGCRFREAERIQFFIDIKTNIENILSGMIYENSNS